MNIDFILNGEDVNISADPLEKLSMILRNNFGFQGVIDDCLEGYCGKCIVFFNGKAINSCMVPAFRIRGSEIITYEGFKNTDAHAQIDKAFSQTGTVLCGFCNAAYYLVMGSLLDQDSRPSDSVIIDTVSSVYCRCITPSLIIKTALYAVENKYRRDFNIAYS